MILRAFLALLFLPLVVCAAEFELPDPPAGQVLDGTDWLGSTEKEQLDSELTRLREAHGIDVLVVIWSQAIKAETNLQELARRLGETWNRGELWAVVLQKPEALAHPIVAWGGLLLKDVKDAPVEEALNNAVSRGLKEWSDRGRVSGVALNLGEELAFQQNRHLAELEAKKQRQAAAEATANQQRQTDSIRYVLIVLGGVIVIALAVFGWLRFRSRKSDFQFPQTRWRRRLGASWSGGGKLITSFIPRDSD